ncbi:hypothetical protein BC939DRAFT_504099 [Gamsiella multidivaricata]|uniref:uncharacterized protein n=1 Tax=Gamsiella multidivaricata TaxID=101098 RepID=UPI00221F8317|nr:uncharacterized protein BC939DRAFT_504099 [Gamsiella multidivaricata]KAG0359188.1 hypothetical protein BGZ54_010070 [Gamsiella multidivaricata]KAI7822061.1 hypothetical protein BC939DRAFT_504099 [Gamsiella multidivaricata]
MSKTALVAHTPLKACSRLAPEVILHILSFLGGHDQPSRLWPILTLCKQWARLALELIYDQPVVSLKNLDAFVKTLGLQDRLQDGRSLFWDSATCLNTKDNSSEDQPKSLGIDYRAMIKKPCRIVGASAPVKQDLIHLWDLQALLWTAPAFAPMSAPLALSLSSPVSNPVRAPGPGPGSGPAPGEASSSSSPPSAEQPHTIASSSSSSSHPSLESLGPASQLHRAPSPPSSTKAVMIRRKKKTLPPLGPVVLLLDVSQVFSDTMYYILREVPGMRLRQLHYKWLLNVSLLDLLEMNLSALRELVFARPPTRQNEFLAIAQFLKRAQNLDTLRLDHCRAAGNTVLTQLAQSCGRSLRTLEIRQHIMIRPMGDHTLFPVDGPEDFIQHTEQEQIQEHLDPDLQSATRTLSPGQMCSRCGAEEQEDGRDAIESAVDQLGISGDPTAASGVETTPDLPQDNVLPEMDLESRMDHALKEFGQRGVHLTHLRLQHVTWLTDECLSEFQPNLAVNRSGCPSQMRPGLQEIELLDSYYGSQVTIEGVLDLCGPNLEVLVVDRKSCWRVRASPKKRSVSPELCASCARQGRAQQTRIDRMSTGDRLLSGLKQKGDAQGRGRIGRLETLVLIEHWVSVDELRKAMAHWRLTLRTVNARVFKCSIKELTRAIVAPESEETCSAEAALENVVLALPWLDVDSLDSEAVGLASTVFERCRNVRCVEINKRSWRRDDHRLLSVQSWH